MCVCAYVWDLKFLISISFSEFKDITTPDKEQWRLWYIYGKWILYFVFTSGKEWYFVIFPWNRLTCTCLFLWTQVNLRLTCSFSTQWTFSTSLWLSSDTKKIKRLTNIWIYKIKEAINICYNSHKQRMLIFQKSMKYCNHIYVKTYHAWPMKVHPEHYRAWLIQTWENGDLIHCRTKLPANLSSRHAPF